MRVLILLGLIIVLGSYSPLRAEAYTCDYYEELPYYETFCIADLLGNHCGIRRVWPSYFCPQCVQCDVPCAPEQDYLVWAQEDDCRDCPYPWYHYEERWAILSLCPQS